MTKKSSSSSSFATSLGDAFEIKPHRSGRGAYAARACDAMSVIARDNFVCFAMKTTERLDRERKESAHGDFLCDGCGAFVGQVASSFKRGHGIALPDTDAQTMILNSAHADAYCKNDNYLSGLKLFVGRRGHRGDVERMAARLIMLKFIKLFKGAVWQNVVQISPAMEEKIHLFDELYHDVSILDQGWTRAQDCVERLRDIVANGSELSDEARTHITVDLWLQTVSKIMLNSIAVKIPHPMVRYVMGLEEEAPNVRNAAAQPLKTIITAACERKDETDETDETDDSDDSDDSDSDSDSDSADSDSGDSDSGDSESDEGESEGDDVMEFTIPWDQGSRTFTTDIFPPSEGFAVLGFCASINHSCEPNCEIAYIDDANALVVSTKQISKGEEITIPYVPVSLPVNKRRAMLLKRYGFLCDCVKCQRETTSVETLLRSASKKARVETITSSND